MRVTSILEQNDGDSRTKKQKKTKKKEQPESFFLVLLKAAIVAGGTKTGLQGKGTRVRFNSVNRLQLSAMGVAHLEGYNE